MALQGDVLRVRLRQTRTEGARGTICAEPWSIRSRPAMRTEMSEMESMRVLFTAAAVKRNRFMQMKWMQMKWALAGRGAASGLRPRCPPRFALLDVVEQALQGFGRG